MRRVKLVLLFWVGLFSVLALVGLALPDHVHIERSVQINASPNHVYEIVSDFHQFERWSPFAKQHPDTEYRFTGPETGVGAKMYWISPKADVGKGIQEIVGATPNEFVQMKLDFGNGNEALTAFHLKPIEGQDNATMVMWSFDTDFNGNLVGRYMGLTLDSSLGPEYTAGLAHLKALAEQSQAL